MSILETRKISYFVRVIKGPVREVQGLVFCGNHDIPLVQEDPDTILPNKILICPENGRRGCKTRASVRGLGSA